jgi:hypothetical protein
MCKRCGYAKIIKFICNTSTCCDITCADFLHVLSATIMWGIGMANENEPGRSTEEPVNSETFDQVSDEGDGPSHSEATQAASALAGQDEENNRRDDDEDEESKYFGK